MRAAASVYIVDSFRSLAGFVLPWIMRTLLVLGFAGALLPPVSLRAQSFTAGVLQGTYLSHPTTLGFGPDGRLYVAQQDGRIYAYTITRAEAGAYRVVGTELIEAVHAIPNHDDDGRPTSVAGRQVTGLLATGTATRPILYVTSSDPRIGGEKAGTDTGLDTNSSMISRLRWTGEAWEKVDLVRGLPRSEENHASNGLALDPAGRVLYVAQGGHTNAGAPSNHFAFGTEYALSGAILAIDLDAIEALPTRGTPPRRYKYDLPTLDDPTRTGTPDAGDPFGGNDGLNQARLVPGGPVQVYAPGFRNPYDLLWTTKRHLYTIDNGPNVGWGGYPDGEGTTACTNRYPDGEPGSVTPGTDGSPRVNNRDGLHRISEPGYYGGHPNPVRGNPEGAGLFTQDGIGVWRTGAPATPPLPADWPPVAMARPEECDYRQPGVDDGALHTWATSTNGLTEYKASNFEGVLRGDLLTVSFDGHLYRVALNEAGDAVTGVTSLASKFGALPLDVTAQGDADLFPGTIWAALYAEQQIVVFEPEDYGTCPAVSSMPSAEAGCAAWQAGPGRWTEVAATNEPTARHENAFVALGGKLYLLGGRGHKPLEIYDPITDHWTTGAAPPVEMHHVQAVGYEGKVYVVGAYSGTCCADEFGLRHVYVYDPETDAWRRDAPVPAARQRGAAGAVVYQDRIYVVGGLQGGHGTPATSHPWLDVFDPATGAWTPLPDAPHARDHFHAVVLEGKLYAVGGRVSSDPSIFEATISEVDVYDFATETWTTLPAGSNLPTPRGGSTTVVLNGEVVVMGGETGTQRPAHREVEAFDPATGAWRDLAPLGTGRHGTQATLHDGHIYIAAGSGNRGGGPELTSLEAFAFEPATTSFGQPPDQDRTWDLWRARAEVLARRARAFIGERKALFGAGAAALLLLLTGVGMAWRRRRSISSAQAQGRVPPAS